MMQFIFLFKIKSGIAPLYLCDIVPKCVSKYQTRNCSSIRNFAPGTVSSSSGYFSPAICNWNKIDLAMRNLLSVCLFQQALLKFICPSRSHTYATHNFHCLKYFNHLNLGTSQTTAQLS